MDGCIMSMRKIRSHWISLDVCPVCKSEETFHSEWMKDPQLQKESSINAYRLYIAKSRPDDEAIWQKNEVVFSKEDLCLNCGHTWIMYVERSVIEQDEDDIKIPEKPRSAEII